MLANTSLYAAKKRKKPVQKIPKPPPPNGAKSNPSKRHRDRLNGELDKLSGLLPFSGEVRARLDKLSVLRLSVGYLKAKGYFNAAMKKGHSACSWTGEGSLALGAAPTPSSFSGTPPSSSRATSIDGVSFDEGDLLLQAVNGFVMVVTAEGYVFYTSPTIQDFLGFHQSDVVHQSVFELIHADDRALFRRQLHFALNLAGSQQDGGLSEQSSAEVSANVVTYDPRAIPPENSSFLERNFCCRFRCLLDNSSGFLALNFRGRLKFIGGQNRVSADGASVPPQLALFCIATQTQPPSILQIRTKTLIFQTKHKLDFTPLGIDSRGKVVLGYNEVELCMKGSGYNFVHAADMMYCADNHVRMMKTGESGFSVFRLLSKTGSWIWVQANARLVFKAGKPDFIVARQRALMNEEGEDQLRLRRLQLPFNFATGEALLYDVAPAVGAPDPCSAPKQRKLDDCTVSRGSLLGCMLSQDQSLYCEHNKNNAFNSIHDAAFKDSRATVSVPTDLWEPAAARPGRSEATAQDMMETLQQILGENDLSEALDVGPEELRSWESALLRMSSNGCEVSDNLEDILGNDVLAYVEEQLRREGALEPPGAAPGSFGASEPRDQNLGWTPAPQRRPIPNGGPSNPAPQQAAPLAFDPSAPLAAGQVHPRPTQSPLQTWTPSGLWDQSARGQSAPGSSAPWSSASNADQACRFLETFGQSAPSYPVGGRFGLTTQFCAGPAPGLGTAPAFAPPETPAAPLPFHPSGRMFRGAPPSTPLSGLQAAGFYGALPGGGALPGPGDAVPPCLQPDAALSFCEQTQVSRPLNTFSSPPNAYYPDSQ
ncbi:aryl hydrocarbon receptor-like [Pungitius pungitius]|uniref:aryl hydrocarbon receptor-like n=1 Tax=Pungitius pungitius TaxID=134920 RepID=UPI002E1604D9